MNISKSNRIVLQKILKEISIISDVTRRYTRDEFLTNDIAQRAIAMTIINIGGSLIVFLTSVTWR